MNMRDNPTLH